MLRNIRPRAPRGAQRMYWCRSAGRLARMRTRSAYCSVLDIYRPPSACLCLVHMPRSSARLPEPEAPFHSLPFPRIQHGRAAAYKLHAFSSLWQPAVRRVLRGGGHMQRRAGCICNRDYLHVRRSHVAVVVDRSCNCHVRNALVGSHTQTRAYNPSDHCEHILVAKLLALTCGITLFQARRLGFYFLLLELFRR